MQNYLSDLYKKLSGKMKLGRQRTEKLMEALDHPERSYPSIHIAGTNGKGTVTVLSAAFLEAQGLKTGRFTSPHLVKFNERICVNRKQIDDDYIKQFLETNEQLLNETEASFFEVTTALGFQYFKDMRIDAAVIETGLGGRLDATSVIEPKVSVITKISLDHINILGETLSDIAEEKAGIIKDAVPLLTAVQEPGVVDVFWSHTELVHVIDPGTMFTDIKLSPEGMRFKIRSFENELFIPLSGRHQLSNIALAIRAVETFLDRTLSPDDIQAGFDLLEWKGRFERIAKDPDVIYDVAHNLDSVQAFRKTVEEIYSGKEIRVVLGLLHDKAPEKVLMELEIFADKIWLAPVKSHRSMSMDELEDLASRFPRVNVAECIQKACDKAYDKLNDGVLCIIGSHYIAEDVYVFQETITKLQETKPVISTEA